MNFSVNNILAGVLFGIIGTLVFREGKKRTSVELYFIGVALMLYPYAIDDGILVWVVGVGLTGAAVYQLKNN